MDMAAWLRSLGLEQHEQTFHDNAVDFEVLPDLTNEHLKELGIPLGHRLKLLKAVAVLRNGAAADHLPPPATAPVPSSAAEGERRQVTVLFADLVGYTALSREVDAEDVHALLGRLSRPSLLSRMFMPRVFSAPARADRASFFRRSRPASRTIVRRTARGHQSTGRG